MKSVLIQVERATKLLKAKPQIANPLSPKGEKLYQEAEKRSLVDLYTSRLAKYLESEEGRAVRGLFSEMWGLDSETWGLDGFTKTNQLRWRILLYRSENCNNSNRQEVIWFGGNGLELYYVEKGSNKYHSAPISPAGLIERIVFNDDRFNAAEVVRPEQVIPYIRTCTMELVRYLNR